MIIPKERIVIPKNFLWDLRGISLEDLREFIPRSPHCSRKSHTEETKSVGILVFASHDSNHVPFYFIYYPFILHCENCMMRDSWSYLLISDFQSSEVLSYLETFKIISYLSHGRKIHLDR